MAEKKDDILHINKHNHVLLTLPLCKIGSGEEVLAQPESCMEFFIEEMKNLLEGIKAGHALSRTEQGGRGVIFAGLETEDVLLGIMCLSDFFKTLPNYKDPNYKDSKIRGNKIQRCLFNLDLDKLKDKTGEKQRILDIILRRIICKELVKDGSFFSPLTVFLLSDSEHISTIIYDNINEKFYSFDSMGTEYGSHKSILPEYVESLNKEKIQNTSFCGYITMKFCKELFSQQHVYALCNGFENELKKIVAKTKKFAQGITNPENKARGESDLKRAITEIKENIERNLLPSR